MPNPLDPLYQVEVATQAALKQLIDNPATDPDTTPPAAIAQAQGRSSVLTGNTGEFAPPAPADVKPGEIPPGMPRHVPPPPSEKVLSTQSPGAPMETEAPPEDVVHDPSWPPPKETKAPPKPEAKTAQAKRTPKSPG